MMVFTFMVLLGVTDKREDVKSGEEYFARHLQFEYQKNRRRRHRVMPFTQSMKSDAENDVDIRPKRSDADNDIDIRPQRQWRRHHGDYQTLQYAVPTNNRYESLNY